MNQKSQDLDFLKNTMVQNINRLLYKKNWSIRQLSDQAGLPYESIKKLVGGKIKNPTIYTISKVCDALDCSIDYLLGRSVINTIDQKSLPPRVFNLLAEIAYFESRIADYNQSHKTDCVSVLLFRMEWFLTVFLRILLIFLLTKKILVTLFCVGLRLLGEIFHLLILTMTFF